MCSCLDLCAHFSTLHYNRIDNSQKLKLSFETICSYIPEQSQSNTVHICCVQSLIALYQLGFLHHMEEVKTSSFLCLNPQQLECESFHFLCFCCSLKGVLRLNITWKLQATWKVQVTQTSLSSSYLHRHTPHMQTDTHGSLCLLSVSYSCGYICTVIGCFG